VGILLTGGLLFLFLVPSFYLVIAAWIRGRGERPSLLRRVPAFFMRWSGRLLFGFLLVLTLTVAFGGGNGDDSSGSPSYDPYAPYDPSGFGDGSSDSVSASDLLWPGSLDLGDLVEPWRAWFVLFVFALIALCTAAQRTQFARAMAAELSPQRFPDVSTDPAEQDGGERTRWLKDRIRIEQHAPLIMYHEARPFCGAGIAYDTWVLAIELRPDEEAEQHPLNNRTVLEKIRPLLEQLRLPSEYAAHPVRDRLRRLEIDECVFLPAEGLPRRNEAPYHPHDFEEHRARAVEEGAEKRRHFLRIRVGGWEEELVVTVFVRIHTQGRMLMLEIAPHVLTPIREDFKDADRAAHRFRHNNAFGKVVAAVVLVPGSAVRSTIKLCRSLVYPWRQLTGGYAGALPDGPALSVRELGSTPYGSLFQRMDVDRYLRSMQDRITHGVRTALAESGYQTDEFVQKVQYHTHNNSLTNFGTIDGSTFGVGTHVHASSTTTGGPAPQNGPGSYGHGG
jgi:hypothetical protein